MLDLHAGVDVDVDADADADSGVDADFDGKLSSNYQKFHVWAQNGAPHLVKHLNSSTILCESFNF